MTGLIGAEKYRNYAENMVNVLGFDPRRSRLSKSENFDRIMAFDVIDTIAEAPDYWFDDRNELARERCRQIRETIPESIQKEIQLDREHFPKINGFCQIFCRDEIPKMHRSLQQSYITYLLNRIRQSTNPICTQITKKMNAADLFWTELPLI